MKNTKIQLTSVFLSYLLVIVSVSAILCGCGKNFDEEKKEAIVAHTWIMQMGSDSTMEISFNSDGTGKAYAEVSDTTDSVDFTWEINHSSFIITTGEKTEKEKSLFDYESYEKQIFNQYLTDANDDNFEKKANEITQELDSVASGDEANLNLCWYVSEKYLFLGYVTFRAK